MSCLPPPVHWKPPFSLGKWKPLVGRAKVSNARQGFHLATSPRFRVIPRQIAKVSNAQWARVSNAHCGGRGQKCLAQQVLPGFMSKNLLRRHDFARRFPMHTGPTSPAKWKLSLIIAKVSNAHRSFHFDTSPPKTRIPGETVKSFQCAVSNAGGGVGNCFDGKGLGKQDS